MIKSIYTQFKNIVVGHLINEIDIQKNKGNAEHRSGVSRVPGNVGKGLL
jgi:hypothetical protein